MKTALVTGALGFCGRHLIYKLRENGDIRVCGIDMVENVPPGVFLDEYVCADICSQERVDHAIELLKPDLVFHLAGVIGDDSFSTYNVNFMGSLHLLESVRKYAPESRVVLIGSSAEYSFASPDDFPLTENYPCHPVTAYGISKHATVLAGTNYFQHHGLKVVIARPFNIIGPGIPPTLVVGAILKRMNDSLRRKDDPVIKMGNLDTERDFVDVDDAVSAYIKMAQGDYWGEVFNICSGKPYSIRKIVEMIGSFSNLAVRIEQDPALIRSLDIKVSYGNYEKAHKAFGFAPVADIEMTLLKTWRYYMENAVMA
jgi:GDP-4-dehydro-6-deoxy-D-mannose reductase